LALRSGSDYSYFEDKPARPPTSDWTWKENTLFSAQPGNNSAIEMPIRWELTIKDGAIALLPFTVKH
jgi:hypothetical protein